MSHFDNKPIELREQAISSRMFAMGRERDLELYDDVVAMGREAAKVLRERFFT